MMLLVLSGIFGTDRPSRHNNQGPFSTVGPPGDNNLDFDTSVLLRDAVKEYEEADSSHETDVESGESSHSFEDNISKSSSDSSDEDFVGTYVCVS
jgi:hypothetical protein